MSIWKKLFGSKKTTETPASPTAASRVQASTPQTASKPKATPKATKRHHHKNHDFSRSDMTLAQYADACLKNLQTEHRDSEFGYEDILTPPQNLVDHVAQSISSSGVVSAMYPDEAVKNEFLYFLKEQGCIVTVGLKRFKLTESGRTGSIGS